MIIDYDLPLQNKVAGLLCIPVSAISLQIEVDYDIIGSYYKGSLYEEPEYPELVVNSVNIINIGFYDDTEWYFELVPTVNLDKILAHIEKSKLYDLIWDCENEQSDYFIKF